MPILNKPDMNYGVWADGGNIEIPSSEKVEEGWVIEKPLNETMNWLQNRQDSMLQYINERGIPEWDARTQYPLDAYVARSGIIYKAISPSTDKDPTLHTNIWQIAFVTQADFDNYSNKVNSIETKDGYLEWYVSKASPVLTGIAKGIAYNNSTGVSGLSFDGLKPKVTNSGKTVAEFSGGANPKDVVTHEQLNLAIQVFKVGSIYTTTTNENPRVTFGYGTWERFGRGRTLVGFTDEVSNSIPEWTKIANREFGSYDHKLTVEELPSHKHSSDNIYNKFGSNSSESGKETIGSGDFDRDLQEYGVGQMSPIDWQAATERFVGGNRPHNNVQPSLVVYFWKRTA